MGAGTRRVMVGIAEAVLDSSAFSDQQCEPHLTQRHRLHWSVPIPTPHPPARRPLSASEKQEQLGSELVVLGCVVAYTRDILLPWVISCFLVCVSGEDCTFSGRFPRRARSLDTSLKTSDRILCLWRPLLEAGVNASFQPSDSLKKSQNWLGLGRPLRP